MGFSRLLVWPLGLFGGAPCVCAALGCGGAVVQSNSASPDAASSLDAAGDDEATAGDRTVPAFTTSDDGQAEAGNGGVAVDANPHCECQNLEQCCNSGGQADADACRSEVAQGSEDACRQAVLQDRYSCLSIGFAPRCPGIDDQLCPHVTTPCSQCLTSTSNCVWVIQCVANPACKPTLDETFACDRQGRPFSECFNILQANGQVPGDLILRGAACESTCQADR